MSHNETLSYLTPPILGVLWLFWAGPRISENPKIRGWGSAAPSREPRLIAIPPTKTDKNLTICRVDENSDIFFFI